ncbi:hydroxyethylthiazole kinase [Acetobacterium wieringae]|uniref:Hydroxyethylthiazole kinase n=1 Tax=Acetobacterium wieringae TaxID=52694 RepID=A0ABY6HG04_9FIRM|nr:hydroxyethylthiazole kinase [Acetobacterium wieringae]UYO62488.1 hydroxyethylthiazole kinase [Acetobacterium wieringae]VUZ25404.1 Hydroxyethylthiazole kinase [Acetobacterium wieringae]
MLRKILENVRNQPPLVHSITNYVTVNDCANIVLACGGAPIMADDINEVEEIIAICNALVINIGTLNERTVASMIKAGKEANRLGRPVILDPVGAGASTLRTETVFKLLKEVQFSVIRGNVSEIKTIASGSGRTKGVDADISDAISEDNLDGMVAFAKALSQKTGAVIAITGAIDIVADSQKALVIRNGHPMMSRITGTGCMLTTVIGSYCGANPDDLLLATAAAVSCMGLCGELAFAKVAAEQAGTASFRTYLIDAMSRMDAQTLAGGIKIETR